MTTREELLDMIDQVADDDLDSVAQLLRPLIEREQRGPGPKSLGMGRSGYSDTSERADEILRDTGFGE